MGDRVALCRMPDLKKMLEYGDRVVLCRMLYPKKSKKCFLTGRVGTAQTGFQSLGGMK